MPPPAAKPAPTKLVPIGAAVVVAGFLLPQLFGTSTPPAPPSAAASPDYAGFLLKMLVGLAVLAGGCVAFVKWKKPAPVAAGSMEILATVTLARGLVHLVRAGDRRLLIGVDPAGVKAIAELPSNVVGPVRVPLEAA